MSVRIRNGKFVVDYYVNGRSGTRRRVTLPDTVPDIKAAKEIERDLRRAHVNIAVTVPANGNVKDLFPHYLSYVELHKAPRTHVDIKSVYDNHLKSFFDSLRVGEIANGHIDVYKRLRMGQRVTNRTINKELAYLSSFLKWCRKYHDIYSKVTIIERLPHVRPIPQVLSFEEAMRLIDAAKPFYRAFFLCLYGLGLRVSEARNLKWEDVDETNLRVVIKNAKNWKTRVLPVPDILHKALQVIKPSSAKGYIFILRRTEKPVDDIRSALEHTGKRAGIKRKVNPHLLRHSFATHLMQKNVNIRIIQEWLGHSKESTTEFYTHVAIENLRDASDVLFGNS